MLYMCSPTLHFCLLTTASAIDWKTTMELTLTLHTEATFMCRPVKPFVHVKESCLCVLHGTGKLSGLKTSACHNAVWLLNGCPGSFLECPIAYNTSPQKKWYSTQQFSSKIKCSALLEAHFPSKICLPLHVTCERMLDGFDESNHCQSQVTSFEDNI